MRRLAALLAVTAACGSPKEPAPAGAGRPSPAIAAASDEPESAGVAEPPPPNVVPLTPDAQARIKAAAQTLAKSGCDADAMREIRALQQTHGDPELLIKAQQVAFKVCEDPVALAELLARTLADDAPATSRLQVGAAWLRASRYPEAIEVLKPLAQAEGPTSKAAWLAGFAMFHAGQSAQARPLLESARAQAPTDRSDAWLLIGLCKLHAGDIEGATAEFEAGVERVTDDPSLWSALSRAYAASSRPGDAAGAEAEARKAHDARALKERTQSRLAASAKAFQAAAKTQDVAEVERLFDVMWPHAPAKLRLQLLQVRARVYTAAGLDDKADADNAQAKALVAATPNGGKNP